MSNFPSFLNKIIVIATNDVDALFFVLTGIIDGYAWNNN